MRVSPSSLDSTASNPTCASRHNHTRGAVWLRHNSLLRRKLFRVFGSMSAPSEGPQAKSLPSSASACTTTGLWLKGQSLALRRWWPLHDMHPAWFAGRLFLVARLTGAARSVCSGRFGRVANKMVPQGRFWAGASDEKRCVRSVGPLGCVECGLGLGPACGLDCSGWHHGLLLPSLEMLKCARANGCDWSAGTCKFAAGRGHHGTLKWAQVNGCPFRSDGAQTPLDA